MRWFYHVLAVQLMQSGKTALAALYIVLSLMVGTGAVFIGQWAAR